MKQGQAPHPRSAPGGCHPAGSLTAGSVAEGGPSVTGSSSAQRRYGIDPRQGQNREGGWGMHVPRCMGVCLCGFLSAKHKFKLGAGRGSACCLPHMPSRFLRLLPDQAENKSWRGRTLPACFLPALLPPHRKHPASTPVHKRAWVLGNLRTG